MNATQEEAARAAATARAVTKAGWRILPLLGIAYLMAFVDRVNISFAATQMNADLGFSATIYGLGGGMFFLAYSLFEIPSNMLLLRFGARRWIARIMITWGILAAAMMFVRTPLEFYALRFLVGMAEAGFAPGAVYFISSWFPAAQRGRAIGMFYFYGPLSSVVMGVLSGWLLAMDGTAGLRGWQWLFLVEGLPASLVGLLILFFLPDSPEKVSWLTDDERQGLLQTLAAERHHPDAPGQHKLLAILRNPKVMLLAAMYCLSISSLTAFVLSAPTILVEATGRSVQQIGTLVSIGGLFGAGAMMLSGWFVDWKGERFSALFFGMALLASSFLIIAMAPSPLMVMAAYLMFEASRCIQTLAQVSLWSDLLRDEQLAIGGAAINTVAQMGSFLAPFAFGAARDATGSYTAGLYALPVLVILAMGLSAILMRRMAMRTGTV